MRSAFLSAALALSVLSSLPASAADLVDDVAEPIGESLEETVDPGTDPVEEVVEPVAEPVEETVEPVTDPVEEVVEPVTEPVEEVVEPVTEPVEEVIEPVTEPTEEPPAPAPDSGPSSEDDGSSSGSGPGSSIPADEDGATTVTPTSDLGGSAADVAPPRASSPPSLDAMDGSAPLGGADGAVLRLIERVTRDPSPSPIPPVAPHDSSIIGRLLEWVMATAPFVHGLVAGPLVALEVLVRALLSAGSGLVAPASLLAALLAGTLRGHEVESLDLAS